MSDNQKGTKNAWWWVPSLYYAEGIPYVVVMAVSVIMYKRMGVSNTDIALYTSWLYLPWVIKPLWSPVVDLFKTKRFWIVAMQILIGGGLAGVALTIPMPSYFQWTLAFLWLLAFSSATHDIAADGFYLLGLSKYDQAWFVGIRSTFYRLASITGQGILVILAGYIESSTGLPPVEVAIHSSPSATVSRFISPDSVNFENSGLKGELVSFPSSLTIGTNDLEKTSVDSIIKEVKIWNSKNGFTPGDAQITGTSVKTVAEPSWIQRNFVQPIENFLRDNFGPKTIVKSDSKSAGNYGILYFKYTGESKDKTVQMNFSRESGEERIAVVEGSRLEFNASNKGKTAAIVIQLDKKLKAETTAHFKAVSGNVRLAWVVTFAILSFLFVLFFIYHKFILPYPADDKKLGEGSNVLKEFLATFGSFFKRKHIIPILLFLLFYRFAEAQLVKLVSPFLLDTREAGGLGITTGQLGIIYGTIGVAALVLGGILGGIAAAKKGLKFWLWFMAFAIHLPDLAFIYLSQSQTQNLFVISGFIALEQFGYGFGFTAYMLYMMYVADGEHKTAHYAITTGFMALGMMIPGMFSGWLQDLIGYQHFFIWVVIATIPGFVILKFIPLDADFGRKT